MKRTGGIRASSTYVPSLGRVAAEAKACRVAAGYKDEPLLSSRGAGRGVNGQNLLPVLEGDGMLNRLSGLGGSFGGRGVDGRRGRRGDGRRHGSRGFVDKSLELLEKRDLLSSDGDSREGEEKG